MNLVPFRHCRTSLPFQLLFVLAAFMLSLPVSAQENIIHQEEPDLLLKRATLLFKRGLYSDAQPLFKKHLNEIGYFKTTEHQLSVDEAAYHYIVCAFKLDQPDALAQAEDFLKKSISSANRQRMNFAIGHHYFQKKQFEKAIHFYERADINNFTNDEISKAKFEQAYSYFNLKQFDKAYPLFNAVKDVHNQYYVQANYYTGYISLQKKDYDNALKSFNKIVHEPKYERVVPYYIAEIYYYTDQYDKLLTYALPFLKKGNLYYDANLQHLIGQTYFEKQEYDTALPYLAHYEEQAQTLQKEDVYELAYSYYKTNQLEKAIAGFKQLSNGTDSLAQNSMYILGDCYLKTGQKKEARHAFAFCARSSYNPKQQEISIFNYGKLSYELGYQDAALKTLKSFISDYPQSEYKQESKEILAHLFMNTADYKNALAVLQDLPKEKSSVKEAYQRVTFGRAMQLINDGNMTESNQLLDKSLQYPISNSLVSLTHFWQGEIALRDNRPDEAIRDFNLYIPSKANSHPPALGEANIQTAQYNLGYSYLKKKQYREALTHFQQAQRVFGTNGTAIANDARLREADCYYMLKDYDKASNLYNKVITNGGSGSDYALYQKGIISGITGNNTQKVSILNQLSNKYPQSGYSNDANYQIGNTYIDEGDYQKAIPYLQKAANNPNNPEAPKALLKLALAHFNLNQTDKASNGYKQLIRKYPNSSEASDAMTSLKNIYINEGQTQKYFTFLNSIGRSINTSAEDSITYAAAESSFATSKYDRAIQQFSKYLTDFPNGQFKEKAHFYRAESAYNEKDYTQAVKDYETVLKGETGVFTQHSALRAASINFHQKENYTDALNDYRQLLKVASSKENTLTALRGILRSTYELQKWKEVDSAAQRFLALKDISTNDQIVSYFYLGRSAQEQQNCSEAIKNYQKVAGMTTSELGAESRYYIALCKYNQKELKDAETAAFDVIKKTPSYDFWVTKTYILLGKIFWEEKDYFNAKATLQSIVDHSKLTELVDDARELLDQIKTEEQKQSKIATPSSSTEQDSTNH